MDNELDFKGADKLQAVVWFTRLAESLDGEKEYTITVKERKRKRSLDANAYFWVLCGKLAERLHIPKTDIYRNYIREIGGNYTIIGVQEIALEHFRAKWEENHIGRFTETMPSKREGWANVIVYYGSSDYDTATMSRLIEMTVNDCKDQGIPTYSQEEVDRLVQEWGVE